MTYYCNISGCRSCADTCRRKFEVGGDWFAWVLSIVSVVLSVGVELSTYRGLC